MPDEPATPADVMAAAFGAEMLHIDFYSRGISLPHHERPDFQREWRAIAVELGMPGLRHEGLVLKDHGVVQYAEGVEQQVDSHIGGGAGDRIDREPAGAGRTAGVAGTPLWPSGSP